MNLLSFPNSPSDLPKDLPDEFTFELPGWHSVRFNRAETDRAMHLWQALRSEVQRRGFHIIEERSAETFNRYAHCKRVRPAVVEPVRLEVLEPVKVKVWLVTSGLTIYATNRLEDLGKIPAGAFIQVVEMSNVEYLSIPATQHAQKFFK